jgi:hypothetical protein
VRKTLVLVIVLCFIPLFVFADLGVGGSAFFNSPVLIGQTPTLSGLSSAGFTFGGDLRFKLSLLQLDALALVTVKDVTAINLYADAGLALDILFLRLSLGAGPTVGYVFGGPEPMLLGFNAKANVDLMLGRLSLGLSYIMDLIVNDGIRLDRSTGLLGASVLIWF